MMGMTLVSCASFSMLCQPTGAGWVELSDGRTLGVPLAWFPRLLHGSAAEREEVRISGRGLHWALLDEDISIAGLLAGLGDRATSKIAV
jgi:hypothetical protein